MTFPDVMAFSNASCNWGAGNKAQVAEIIYWLCVRIIR